MAPKMAFFTGFGPRRAAGLAEQPKFFFAIVIWHLNEHSVRVSALNSKIFLISTPFRVVYSYALHLSTTVYSPKISLPDPKTQGSVVFPPRATRGAPADEFCYFDGIAKFFFG